MLLFFGLKICDKAGTVCILLIPSLCSSKVKSSVQYVALYLTAISHFYVEQKC